MMNPFQEVSWRPDTGEKRKFAVSLMIGFPVLGAIFFATTWMAGRQFSPFPLWLGGVGFAVGALLWLLPSIAKPFYLAWYFVACCIGLVVGNVLFSLFYFLVLTPIGAMSRKFGRLHFAKGFDPKAATYWKEPQKEVDILRYYRQF
jgi:hypothetical protein